MITWRLMCVGVDRTWGWMFPGVSEPDVTWWSVVGNRKRLVCGVYMIGDGAEVRIANVYVN